VEFLCTDVVVGNGKFKLMNVYIPPRSSCDVGYKPSISNLPQADVECIIMGDFNAHDRMWHSSNEDECGDHLASEIDN
jgi:hypothetical protein